MNIQLRFSGGLALAGIALMLPFLTACKKDDRKVIGVVPKGRAHLFWQSVHAGAAKAAQENNIEIVWNGPATETDFNGQLQIPARKKFQRDINMIVSDAVIKHLGDIGMINAR